MGNHVFPILDQLETHGLRQAYLILMLGAGSWNHFQRLHDSVIPETCRLPRDNLLALKRDFQAIQDSRPGRRAPDVILLAEFNRARASHDLHDLYCAIVSSLSMPSDKRREGWPPDCGPQQYSMRIVTSTHWEEMGVGCATLAGLWNGFPARAEVSWYFFADTAYSVHVKILFNAGFERLSPSRTARIINAPRHPSFFLIFQENGSMLSFSIIHALPASVLFEQHEQPRYGKLFEDRRFFRLTADGDRKLKELLSSLGMTEIIEY